nr:MAG TPA: hypothetical protein [Caudoviricetes sp.]
MNKNDYVKGYKVFDPDWTCRGFRYEVGKTFEEDVMPKCCEAGFHFCKELKDCFNYYPFNPDNKVAKVIALGEIDEASNNSKCCTNKIQIVEEISWEDVLRMVNLGKGNIGFCNSGKHNSVIGTVVIGTAANITVVIGTVVIGTVAIITVVMITVAIITAAIITVVMITVVIGTVVIGTKQTFPMGVSTQKSQKFIYSINLQIGLTMIG